MLERTPYVSKPECILLQIRLRAQLCLDSAPRSASAGGVHIFRRPRVRTGTLPNRVEEVSDLVQRERLPSDETSESSFEKTETPAAAEAKKRVEQTLRPMQILPPACDRRYERVDRSFHTPLPPPSRLSRQWICAYSRGAAWPDSKLLDASLRKTRWRLSNPETCVICWRK